MELVRKVCVIVRVVWKCSGDIYYCLNSLLLFILSLSSLLYLILSGDLRTKPIFAVLSLCKSELSELFLNQLSILIQTLFSKN